jgi:V/A-type H+-transporting ATPase subunit I
MSLYSSRAVFITGWMDIRDTEKLFEILRRICGSRFIASISEERDPHAPVRLANTRFVKPFELLVKTMGMPAADELDPTPLAAVTFVLMFGLMFGDLGQGIVLALAGAVLYRIAERKKGSRSTLGQSGAILIVCGLSAALCGILYGSIFSNENIIPALLFHPMSHIMNLFFLTILIGAFIIAAGLMVNIINCLLNSNYSEAFLEKRGLAVLILYGAAVLYFVRYAETGKGMPAWYGILFFLFPLALFAFRGLLGPVLFHSRWPHNWVDYVIETCVEILEIGLSMLANTVSFIRVGAFALSHAGLSIVTYTLAGIADPSLTSPGAIAIIIAGNIFIIGFEALICGIQSMRLEYYEFFSKFFKGDGVVFSPFTLKPQASEV